MLVADAVCLLLACLVAWKLGGGAGVVSAVVGNVLGLANLAAMSWLVARLIGAASQSGKARYGALLGLKLMSFVVIMALVIWTLELQPLGLLIGFSACVLALIVGSLLASLDISPPVAESTSSTEPPTP